MHISRLAFPFLALLVFAGVATASQTLTVTGQDDVDVDRPAIQAAIDAAQPGDTVLLDGTFQLDGTSIFVRTSRLTIAGRSIDDDSDGMVNEDRPDGVDNDGDGLVDEDGWNAVLRGVDDGFGGPALDAFPNRTNDAFEILGFDQDLERIEIRDLEFNQVNRGVYLFPDYADEGTVLVCDQASPRAGSLERVTVEGNAFINGFRGVEMLGRVDTVKVHHNWFSGLSGQGVLLFGQAVGCAEADGSIVEYLPLGTLRKVDIADNEFSAVTIGVLSFISQRTTIRRNVIEAGFAAVASLEDASMRVSRNEMRGGQIGFFGTFQANLEGPSSGNVVSHNSFSDQIFGIFIDCVTTGYFAVGNEFTGSVLSDVALDGTAPGGYCEGIGDSFGNTIIARPSTTVEDYGVDNRILIVGH